MHDHVEWMRSFENNLLFPDLTFLADIASIDHAQGPTWLIADIEPVT